MNLITRYIRWIMLASGALTCTMIYAAIAPQAALTAAFGQPLAGPVAEIVVRSWGVLITLVGALLIHGAFDAHSRVPALAIAAISKLAFIALVLGFGSGLLVHQVGVSVLVDAAMVLLFVTHLWSVRTKRFLASDATAFAPAIAPPHTHTWTTDGRS